MATTKKAPEIGPVRVVTRGRVTSRTPAPYLARVFNMGGMPTATVVFIASIERPEGMPPFGRGVVVAGNRRGAYYRPGMAFTVDNFRCLQRIELPAPGED